MDGCEVHPRVVAQRCLHHNSTAVVLFQSHPSGNPEPSAADRAITVCPKQALALLDVRVLDHLVLGGDAHVSLGGVGVGVAHSLVFPAADLGASPAKRRDEPAWRGFLPDAWSDCYKHRCI
ncbi:JAB domain-containing protein [Lysobacter sp. Root690]|uniref:JAB domain-containing protein n=1 Tax=Lysobacter sp. Root690 TaxID=1736588 RepID=UPI001F2C82FB|nr:JAB domain-containing protein [Lysobacter sp. Root690]